MRLGAKLLSLCDVTGGGPWPNSAAAGEWLAGGVVGARTGCGGAWWRRCGTSPRPMRGPSARGADAWGSDSTQHESTTRCSDCPIARIRFSSGARSRKLLMSSGYLQYSAVKARLIGCARESGAKFEDGRGMSDALAQK